jgi:hypothetical protein
VAVARAPAVGSSCGRHALGASTSGLLLLLLLRAWGHLPWRHHCLQLQQLLCVLDNFAL